MSACVLSLVDLTGASLNVSLRGGTPGLDPGGTSTCSDICNALPLRECAEPSGGNASQTPCGFVYAGLCTSVCGTSNWYGDYTDGVNPTTSHVITAYVIP